MRMILIFETEVKHMLRDKKTLIITVLFPLVLMAILGTALSGAFSTSESFKDIHILYRNSAKASQRAMFFYFLKTGSDLGIRFHETKDRNYGIHSIKNAEYACFIDNNPKGTDIYKNDRHLFQASLVEAALTMFVQKYRVLTTIAATHPARQDPSRSRIQKNVVKEVSFNKLRAPRAIDYYAVTMLTLIIMYHATVSANAIKREKWSHTASRLLCSPVRNHEILIGKILGSLVSSLLQALVVMGVSHYLFQAYWGDRPDMVMLVIMAEVIMAVSIGIGMAFIIENQATLHGLLNLGIPLLVFGGGGYFPIDSFGKQFLQLAALSPLRWTNRAIFQVIYSHDFGTVIPAVAICVGISAIFIGVAACCTRKEVFLG